MQSSTACNICSKIRGLSEHLTELGLAAEYLGNKSTYTSEHGTVTIRTETIGDWVRLAAQLDKVEINAWKFENGAALYCGTAADKITAQSKHYTEHATTLTRFMFVCNGLEEAYRFIDHLYPAVADQKGIERALRKRTSSLRAAELIDDLFDREGSAVEPKDFAHLSAVFIRLFDQYTEKHAAALSGIEPGVELKSIYALHLVRNLRNYVAHGAIPIGVPPDYDYGGFEDSDELKKQLLNHACRIAALYMQVIFRGFSPGFQSYDYRALQDANGPEFERYVQKCNFDYVKDLHLKGEFALHKGLYQSE